MSVSSLDHSSSLDHIYGGVVIVCPNILCFASFSGDSIGLYGILPMNNDVMKISSLSPRNLLITKYLQRDVFDKANETCSTL